ncbi:MAG: class II D-tagatose-bisphosphate aldolase, non-catalytic subunit, partial [Aliifodinibius sp.]|nr:class II D-tagatose-bisphosphate aldolase, non-catalytic subunit [Fodinibius sp.]
VESTSNQVNQFGGYTRMTPKKFAALIKPMY